jgi:general secretion pathway protein D
MVLATPAEYRNILGLLQELDVAPRQVLIEATVAELTLTDELKLGLEWFYRNSMAKGVSTGQTVFSVPPADGVRLSILATQEILMWSLMPMPSRTR